MWLHIWNAPRFIMIWGLFGVYKLAQANRRFQVSIWNNPTRLMIKNERHFHFSVSGAGDYIKDEAINEISRRPRVSTKKSKRHFQRCVWLSIHPRNESLLMACTQDVKLPTALNDWILFICFNPYNQQLFSISRGLAICNIIAYTFHKMHSNLTDDRNSPASAHTTTPSTVTTPKKMHTPFHFTFIAARALKFLFFY